ncbi:MAG: hypothetical protein GYA24_10825 [Candidatus Lokiarchaeota archaeon]|nr:hypothetical protein [Candidatus Lokiarchaeota archaeon]
MMSEREPPRVEHHVAGTVLVIPFSELGTKSETIRAKMLDQLLTNIKHVLKDVFRVPWVKYRTPGERLVFSFRKEHVDAAMDALQRVPGILRMHACVETQPRPDTIARKARELSDRGVIDFDTARVEVRALFFRDTRARNKLVDAVIAALQELPHRQVEPAPTTRPGDSQDAPIYIELHPDFAYITVDRRDGLNGHPVGTQNPVVAEILGRGGDLLAALLAIKRGIVVTPVFFSIGMMALDARRYQGMLAGIKRGIDEFHGFPVKRYFFVPLDELLRRITGKWPELMQEHPCTCCITARHATIGAIMSLNAMTSFVIQGATRLPDGQVMDSCPLDASIHPALNPGQLFLVSPLLAGCQDIPATFTSCLASLPGPPDATSGYTWNFCMLRARDKGMAVPDGIVNAIHEFVTRLVIERANELVVFVDGELPGGPR